MGNPARIRPCEAPSHEALTPALVVLRRLASAPALIRLIATLGILFYGLTLTRFMIRVLQVPKTVIVPIILVLCTIGTFALAGRLFDIYVMVAFGLIGFVLRQFNYPMAPLVLGIVLGDLLDKNFRRAMVLSDGSLEPLFTRPISAVLALLTLAVLPWGLAFAAGAMLFVVSDEIIPESHRMDHAKAATVGVMIGFLAMMFLDVTLGG